MPETNPETQSPDLPLTFDLPAHTSFERLDKVLARLLPQHSRSRLQGWIENGHVRVNDLPAKVRQLVGASDNLLIFPQASQAQQAYQPQAMELDLVAQSAHWLVLNKPAGLVVHPGAGNWGGTLLNGLLHHYPELQHVARAGIVHRLDKDTTGLLVVARTELAQTALVRQLQARSVKREYLALAHGRLMASGTVERPIGRDPRVPIRMTVDQPIAPKPAITHYQVLRGGRLAQAWVSEVACQLETGRTHQIRVHLQSLGYPLLGDALYGGRRINAATRQMLHARRLAFDDVGGNQRLEFDAPLPADFVAACAQIEWES